jgi:epoxyqueuosine reductase
VDLVERIRAEGVKAGLVDVGICAAEAFSEAHEAVKLRLEAGFHAGMAFTFADPARATDVRVSFPWAQRLVVGAYSYLPDAGSPGPAADGTARIARFAVEDYYQPLRRGLEAVAVLLRREGNQAEILVDDSRLMDRVAAVHAGVGWWGKSAMVLVPAHGPWVLLGSVVTDAVLPVERPMWRDCGTCTACMPACPTGAIVAPGVVDARRCLSYLAQSPGIIPRELRSAMGDRLYGCDDCLEACPPGARLLSGATQRRGRIDVTEVLTAADDQLLARFGHFYIPGREVRYLRRNALVVIGNTGDAAAVPLVSQFLGHRDWLLRLHAAWAMARLGGSGALLALRMRLGGERKSEVAEEILLSLAEAEGSA